MFTQIRHVLFGCFALWCASIVSAQPTPIATPKGEPAPARDLIAAKVNGQAIPELAVYRGLLRVPPAKREEAQGRAELPHR